MTGLIHPWYPSVLGWDSGWNCCCQIQTCSKHTAWTEGVNLTDDLDHILIVGPVLGWSELLWGLWHFPAHPALPAADAAVRPALALFQLHQQWTLLGRNSLLWRRLF